MSLRLSILLLACTIGLSACQTTAEKIGTGPIELSVRASAMFEKYKRLDEPGYFIVANDGSLSGYAYCARPGYHCDDDGGVASLDRCNENASSRGTKCSIFAIKKNIVWKGPVTYKKTMAEFMVVISLYDFTNSNAITMAAGSTTDSGNIIQIASRRCIGNVNLRTQTWSLKRCARERNISASGTLKKSTGNQLYVGYGRDSRGEAVEIGIFNTASYSATTKPGSEDVTKKQLPERTSSIFASSAPFSGQNKIHYSLSGIWEGISTEVSGNFIADPNRTEGKLDLNIDPLNKKCVGQWSWSRGGYGRLTPPQGVWSVECGDKITASGTYISEKRGQGIIIGQDNQNRKISMTFK